MGCLPMLSCSHRFPFPATHSLGLAKLVSKRLDIESLSRQSLVQSPDQQSSRVEADGERCSHLRLCATGYVRRRSPEMVHSARELRLYARARSARRSVEDKQVLHRAVLPAVLPVILPGVLLVARSSDYSARHSDYSARHSARPAVHRSVPTTAALS